MKQQQPFSVSFLQMLIFLVIFHRYYEPFQYSHTFPYISKTSNGYALRSQFVKAPCAWDQATAAAW